MKKILIDVDDCICDNVYLKVLSKVVKKNLKPEDCTQYHVETNFNLTQKQIQKYYNALGKTNPYKKAVIHKGCKETLEKLSKKYEIYICSAVVLKKNYAESGNYFKYKYDFLFKSFPFLNPNNFIFTSDKSMVKADIMIDDRPTNVFNSFAKTKLLFTAYHNKTLTDEELKEKGAKRVNNWQEVAEILL